MTLSDWPYVEGGVDQDKREFVCWHEAGHAVVAAALGKRFDYITLRPRDPQAAAHVMSRGQNGLFNGHWEQDGATSAAGILAEDFHVLDIDHRWENPEAAYRYLTRYSGRDDMQALRGAAWRAYARNLENTHWSATATQPHWLPVDFAVAAWHSAIITLVVHWEAVTAVAVELHRSVRKVPYRVVREIVDTAWTDDDAGEDLPEEFLRPWFLEHSRLRWIPSPRWMNDVHRYAYTRREEAAAT